MSNTLKSIISEFSPEDQQQIEEKSGQISQEMIQSTDMKIQGQLKEVFALESKDPNGNHSGYLLFPNKIKGDSFIEFVTNIKGMSSGHTYSVLGFVPVTDYVYESVMKKSQFYVKSLSLK